MSKIFRFIFKWIIPIGFLSILVKNIDFFSDGNIDEIGDQQYYRLSDAKHPLIGADILIRIK